jgi:hypothetical protein
MTITLNGTTGITTPDIDSTAGFDGEDLTGDVAAARITGALNATGSAPIYACRAWVNFNGTGTVAIRASGNVSSITDNGVGQYTVNFTTAMQDVNYCVQLSVRNITNNINSSNNPTYDGAQLTSGIKIGHVENNAANDSNFVHVAIFR